MALTDLPVTLKQRINQLHSAEPNKNGRFVLYLPTVVLRYQHNPAFALACHLANEHHVPVLVLATLLDDNHHTRHCLKKTDNSTSTVVMTARRLAFWLEALQHCSQEWQNHGAGVAIRVHGPQARTPHHLTLTRSAVAVVTDEPFVDPFAVYVERVEQACRSQQQQQQQQHQAPVPVYRVDGSTTVPPISKLQRQLIVNKNGQVVYKGVPAKAWMWEKMTAPKRKEQILATVKDGHLDAPALDFCCEPDFMTNESSILYNVLPREWKDTTIAAPGRRAWSVTELAAISDLKAWAMAWEGADTSVPPCVQTHGSLPAAQKRWNTFVNHHLSSYAKLRNQITKPHAVSRMSCYLNFGIISIFQVLYDLYERGSNTTHAKFHEEIVKWREMSYAHAFANPGRYHRADEVLPQWSLQYLNASFTSVGGYNNTNNFSLEQLASGTTGEATWDAMQEYLVSTGELHNNARMTWGKTVVHWQKTCLSADDLMGVLCYLNDRFALDGLSPPSYAGLLWCLGWCDKPAAGGSISAKPASRYRTGLEGFAQAREQLLHGDDNTTAESPSSSRPVAKKQKRGSSPSPDNDKTQKSILSYFGGKKMVD